MTFKIKNTQEISFIGFNIYFTKKKQLVYQNVYLDLFIWYQRLIFGRKNNAYNVTDGYAGAAFCDWGDVGHGTGNFIPVLLDTTLELL